METYWKVNEVAAALQVSEQTIYRYAANGEIPYHKLNRAVRFKPSEIESWMENRKAGAMANENRTIRGEGGIMDGVLALSRAAELHTEIKGRLEAMGFEDVTVTDKENDALNTVICNKNPRLVIIDSWFYQDGTPCRIGELVKLFPKLNIAVVSVHDFPVSRAPWFI